MYLILSAGLRMLKKMKKNPFTIIIMGATFTAMVTLSLLAVKFSTIFYILIGGIAGVVMYLIKRAKKEGER